MLENNKRVIFNAVVSHLPAKRIKYSKQSESSSPKCVLSAIVQSDIKTQF